MKQTLTWVLGAISVVAIGVVIWFYATTGIDDSTADVTAPTLAPVASEASDAAPSGQTEPGGEGDGSETSQALVPTTQSEGGTVFALAPASTVTFELDEVLRGVDTRVVATNTEVEGQLRLDPSDLAGSEIGVIVVGSQTFETDSGNRDRAIRGPILDAGRFPQIVFEPSDIEGLDGSVSVGDTVSFTVLGGLTIRDITESASFEVTVTWVDEDRIEGRATSVVSRESYGLTIPSVASVADVSDAVDLAIDFVAVPA